MAEPNKRLVEPAPSTQPAPEHRDQVVSAVRRKPPVATAPAPGSEAALRAEAQAFQKRRHGPYRRRA
jgi:hypothetical protein